jgi:hypothetical protein
MTFLLQDVQGGRIGRIPIHDQGFREIVVRSQDCFFKEQLGRQGIPASAQEEVQRLSNGVNVLVGLRRDAELSSNFTAF